MLALKEATDMDFATPPRETEAPCKVKPSCAKSEKESTQETHSGGAFAERVPGCIK